MSTEQFLYGVGMNYRRWLGEENQPEVKVIQLLYSVTGHFPDSSEYPTEVQPQPLLPKEPFGEHIRMLSDIQRRDIELRLHSLH
ncbi:hypothetical protein D3C78_1809090 [compost metagenome]